MQLGLLARAPGLNSRAAEHANTAVVRPMVKKRKKKKKGRR